jgi:hypothetical protein
MKAKILQYMSELIESDNVIKTGELKDALTLLINVAPLRLEEESQAHVKQLIISTVINYADTSDSSLKAALHEHHRTLSELLED